ncbi:hypothetical protein EJD97_007069, partial [Solanum chilense]
LDLVVAFPMNKDWFYVMSQPNRCWNDELLQKYLELSGFFEQNERTNWSILKCNQGKKKSRPFKVSHVSGIAKQERSSLDCGIFVYAYAEYLSDGLQVSSYGISAETLRLRYASVLWNYGIVKARNCYVSDSEDPEMRRTKKSYDR